MAEKQKTVLSIDGGGIRGIIPAMILAEIEERTLGEIRRLINGKDMILVGNQRRMRVWLSGRRILTQGERKKVVLIIDEFDGIPQTVLSDFLHLLRDIYLSDESRCPYSVGIVGVRRIAQLNYDRSVSPFNIQDEFHLPNFTPQQVQELFAQYTEEVDQPFAPEVIEALHKQTAGQPFLVNRFGQILTEELDIPKTETITMAHFSKAHAQLLQEENVNLTHLLTNIRRNPRFENLLMRIVSYERGVQFTLSMYLEVQTGRGRMDLIVLHNNRKYIVETKIWEGERRYQSGKKQLVAYLKLEDAIEGYYVIFDHRATPEPRVETETLEGLTIRSYVIPVIQEHPSSSKNTSSAV